MLAISGIDDFVSGSPQEQAFHWLVSEDELEVCPDETIDVAQRYILSVLYFQTEGDNWNTCSAASASNASPCYNEFARFLGGVDVCLWLNVTCDRGEITEISIG